MMIQPTEEEKKLFDDLKKANTREEVDQINEKIRKLAERQNEELKDCPFVH